MSGNDCMCLPSSMYIPDGRMREAMHERIRERRWNFFVVLSESRHSLLPISSLTMDRSSQHRLPNKADCRIGTHEFEDQTTMRILNGSTGRSRKNVLTVFLEIHAQSTR